MFTPFWIHRGWVKVSWVFNSRTGGKKGGDLGIESICVTNGFLFAHCNRERNDVVFIWFDEGLSDFTKPTSMDDASCHTRLIVSLILYIRMFMYVRVRVGTWNRGFVYFSITMMMRINSKSRILESFRHCPLQSRWENN